jgi:hypothetical protein
MHAGHASARRSARAVPLNLMGGGSFRWPGDRPLDAVTRAKIFWAEIGELTVGMPNGPGSDDPHVIRSGLTPAVVRRIRR